MRWLGFLTSVIFVARFTVGLRAKWPILRATLRRILRRLLRIQRKIESSASVIARLNARSSAPEMPHPLR